MAEGPGDVPRSILGVSAIQRIDIDVLPDGRGLPGGSGDITVGKAVYERTCQHCHGEQGHGGPHGSLAGEPLYDPGELAADPKLKRTVGNYWPYATTVFDYIRRAMPFDRPGSLGDDEVYAVTAYVLYLNGLLDEDAVLDAQTLPGIEMPAKSFFVPQSPLTGAP